MSTGFAGGTSFAEEFRAAPDRLALYARALAQRLEKEGLITYRYHATERVRQMLDRNADLVRRLINGDPAA